MILKMEQFFLDFEERLTTLHADLHNILNQLSNEALDWTPGVEMNSIAVLITHLTAAERYWIGDVAMGESSGRIRSTEFEVHNLTTADLKTRLSQSMAYIQSALPKLRLADLASEQKSARHEQPFTVGWCLLHALEHTAVHTGHIQLAQQLWEQRK